MAWNMAIKAGELSATHNSLSTVQKLIQIKDDEQNYAHFIPSLTRCLSGMYLNVGLNDLSPLDSRLCGARVINVSTIITAARSTAPLVAVSVFPMVVNVGWTQPVAANNARKKARRTSLDFASNQAKSQPSPMEVIQHRHRPLLK